MLLRSLARVAPPLAGLCLLLVSGCGNNSSKIVKPPPSPGTPVWTRARIFFPPQRRLGELGERRFCGGELFTDTPLRYAIGENRITYRISP